MEFSTSSPVGKTSKSRLPSQFSKAFRQLNNLSSIRSSSIELSPQQASKAKRQLDLLQSEHNRLLERVAELETVLDIAPKAKKAKRKAVTRASPFTTLPDLCLLALFRQLPHFAQLTAVQVCTRWSRLVPVVNRTRTFLTLQIGLKLSLAGILNHKLQFWSWLPTEQRSLTHLVDESGRKCFPNCQQPTKWNTLILIALSASTVDRIRTVFSNLEHLTIRLDNTTSTASTIENLLLLLKQHQKKLLSLNLTEHYPLSTPVTIKQIYTTLNSLSTLQRLTLSLYHWPLEDLPILRQLEHFTWHYVNTSTRRCLHKPILRMLAKYITTSNHHLTSIGYSNRVSTLWQPFPGPFTSLLDHHLRDRFTWMDLPEIGDPASLCSNFRNLIYLKLFWSKWRTEPYSYLLAQLATLPKLLYLQLFINLQSLKLIENADQNQPQPPRLRLLPQLHSIRAFDLLPTSSTAEISMSSHQQLQLLNLPWTMPNLEVFHFYFGAGLELARFSCTDCGDIKFTKSWLQGEVQRLEQARRCARLLFEPLKAQCGRLRVILHDREAILGSAQQLLAEAEGTRKIVEFLKCRIKNNNKQ